MKAVIYARCSTNEERQDVENQLKELRDYCNRQGWDYEEHYEYASGSKQIPDKLRTILNLIKGRHYDIFLVYDLTRFSRLHPTTTNKIMDFIVSNKCRFLSLQDNIDSNDEIKWLLIKPMFQYMAYIYSKNLSEKVKLGMKNAREKGKHCGRPKGSKDKKTRSKKGYYLKQKEKLPF
ncbi:MAG: recombinase family protein [Nanoarchaeota archaeon]